MSEGRLFACGTPIGNLGDVSERLREVLLTCDVVYAEDTRRTSKLLNHVGSNAKLRSLFSGNEMARSEELIAAVSDGMVVALVSDAGMPVVSDPGAKAVEMARERGLKVTAIPGPSAVTTAIALSGFSGDRFSFEGFLPKKGSERGRRIDLIGAETRTVVVFAGPHRLHADLVDLRERLGDGRRVAIARELTKIHEEVWVGRLDEAVERWSGEVKGECTLVIEGGQSPQMSTRRAIEAAANLVARGLSHSEAAKEVAEMSGVSRRQIYQGLLSSQDSS
jgi:16S rRNA (cytidine1402-2'-O)-methyltransferase